MKRRIGILTSGGDCPGLNAAIRGVTRAAYELFDAEIVGIHDGYRGLITGDYQEMKRSQFSGILTLGGTILGTARTPFRDMRKIGEDNVDKVAAMKKTYKDLKLDCLVTLGGNGTHKTANLLSKEGLNVIGLPKTIDNDLYGTDFTFGFHTAMDIATEVIDRIHTTAASHGRCMVVELMGNKAGWLTLYSGVAGDAENIERAENEVKQVGNLDAIPASLIADFDYAALGHIHKPMKVGSETLRYCGTPMPYSLSEENQQKGILMVEMGAKGDVQTTVLPLHPVHQVRKLRATRETLLSGASEDFVSICVRGAEAAEMVGLRELLRAKYPNLLELRREREETVELAALQERTETLSPYELCLQFAGERLNAEEKALLTEVMNAMKEENA